MLPVVKGARSTRNQILIYSLIVAPLAVAPYWLGLTGPIYGAVAAVLGVGFIALAAVLWRSSQQAERTNALRLFAFSIFYLFAIFTALAVERLVGFAPGA